MYEFLASSWPVVLSVFSAVTAGLVLWQSLLTVPKLQLEIEKLRRDRDKETKSIQLPTAQETERYGRKEKAIGQTSHTARHIKTCIILIIAGTLFVGSFLSLRPVVRHELPSISAIDYSKSGAKQLRTILETLTTGTLGSNPREAIRSIAPALRDDSPGIRWAAAEAIGRYGSSASEYTDDLIHLMSDTNADVRQASAWALGQIGPQTRESIPALVESLGDDSPAVRQTSALALGKIGSGSESSAEVVSALTVLLHSALSDDRCAAAEALGGFHDCEEVVLASLTDALSDESSRVRKAAVVALGRVGKYSDNVVKILVAALGDESPTVRIAAVSALGSVGKEMPEVSVSLARILLTDQSAEVRRETARELGRMGAHATAALPQLNIALGDNDPSVRREAANAIAKIGPLTIPDIKEDRQSPHGSIQQKQ